jgi:hypothetical protein
MGHLQRESDGGCYCSKLRDLLSYSRRFARAKRKLPVASACSCVYRNRQLHMFQYFAQKTRIYPKTSMFILLASYYVLHS